MQSENGILLLFYIFLSHGKKNEKRGVGCKKGGCCVLSTSTCGCHTQKTGQSDSHIDLELRVYSLMLNLVILFMSFSFLAHKNS